MLNKILWKTVKVIFEVSVAFVLSGGNAFIQPNYNGSVYV